MATVIGWLAPFQSNVRVQFGLLVVLLLAVGVFASYAALRSRSAPELAIPPRQLDLGDGRPGEDLRAVIPLRNTGRAPLTFQIASTCGCTELSPREGAVPPGESVDVCVVVSLPEHLNSERTVGLSITTNEPGEPVYYCTVSASCPAPFQVEPAFVEFGKVDPEDVASLIADVRVTQPEGEERSVQAGLRGDSFVASVETGGSIRVRPAASLDSGDHFDTLEVFLDGNSDDVWKVPVHLHVTPPLSVVPSTLILRREASGRFEPAEWILISNRSDPLGEVTAAEAPPGLRIEKIDEIDDHRHRYRLTVDQRWEGPERFALELEESSTAERRRVQLSLLEK